MSKPTDVDVPPVNVTVQVNCEGNRIVVDGVIVKVDPWELVAGNGPVFSVPKRVLGSAEFAMPLNSAPVLA